MKIIRKVGLFVLMVLLISSIYVLPAVSEVREGGTLNLHLEMAAATLWPVTAVDREGMFLISLAYDTLMEYNDANELQPRLAKSWEVSNDGLTYTFHLRRDVKWHDGQPFTANDVKFTYTLLANKKAASFVTGVIVPIVKGSQDYYDGKVDSISGIQVVDDYTIKFELTKANASFLYSLLFPILPEHLFKAIPVDQLAKAPESQMMVGTGPFKFKRYVTDQYYEFERFEGYWRGKPHIEKVYVKIAKASVALAMLEKGEIDYIIDVPMSELEYIKSLKHIKILTAPNRTWNWCFFLNTKHKFLQDKRIRQAFLYALDRQGYVDSVLRGYGEVINIFNTDALWTVPDSSQINQYPYNPEKAKSLLKEAGWDPKQVVEIVYYPGNEARSRFALIAQQNLKDVGVTADVIAMDGARATEKLQKFDYQILLSGPGALPDPDYISIYFESSKTYPKGCNYHHMADKHIDELFEKGRSTVDPAERARIYKEINIILNDYLPMLPICEPMYVSAMNKRVCGVRFNPNIVFYQAPYRLLDIHKWWLAE